MNEHAMTDSTMTALASSPLRPVTLAIFVITYAGIAVGRVPGLKLNRVGIALLGCIALMIFGGISTADAVSYINWPTVFLLFGFFVVSAQLRLAGFYDRVASQFSARLGHPARFLLLVMLITGGLSAFLNHDIVCFVFAPIVGAALLRKGLNPVPFLIAMAIASNIGAAATLIGNPQDMLIGQVAGLGFGRYLLWSAVPVAFAMAAAYGIIWALSRRRLVSDLTDARGEQPIGHPYNRAHTIKGLVILAVAVGLFFSPIPKEVIALAAAGIHLASTKFRTEDLLGLVEWPLLVLFIALFVITGALQSSGWGEQMMLWLARGGFHINSPGVLVLTTAGLSNLINNSAAVMLLLKVLNLSRPTTAYILALSNSFGGSLIITGSVSSIIVVQQAKELGIRISFRDFARLGVPVTLVALAGLMVWIALVG